MNNNNFIIHSLPAGEVNTSAPAARRLLIDYPAERAPALLEAPGAFLHVHFAGPGCFAFRVDPAQGR